MARWTPQKNDVLDALIAEFVHNAPTGRAIIAVDGVERTVTATFADDLAGRLDATGMPAERRSITPVDLAGLSATAAGFRSAGDDRSILVLDGAILGDPAVRGIANWSVFVDAESVGDRPGRAIRAASGAASAIVDARDPEHPRRVFADSC